jgi:hypothetical protein
MMRFCICISPIRSRESEGIRRANKSHFTRSMCILRASAAAVGSRRRADGRRSEAEQGAKGRRSRHGRGGGRESAGREEKDEEEASKAT